MPFDLFVGDCREVEDAKAVHLPQVRVIKHRDRYRQEGSEEQGKKRTCI